MKCKHIEMAREARLLVGQIIIPAAMVGVTIATNPGLRRTIGDKAYKVKMGVKNWFNK